VLGKYDRWCRDQRSLKTPWPRRFSASGKGGKGLQRCGWGQAPDSGVQRLLPCLPKRRWRQHPFTGGLGAGDPRVPTHPAAADLPAAPRPCRDRTSGATSCFSRNVAKTWHDRLKRHRDFWVARARHIPLPPCEPRAPQLTLLAGAHSRTPDACQEAGGIGSQRRPAGTGNGNGNGNGNSSRTLRLPPAASLGPNRQSNGKTLLSIISTHTDQGGSMKAGRERKVVHFLLSTKVAALFFFLICQLLICLKYGLVKLSMSRSNWNQYLC